MQNISFDKSPLNLKNSPKLLSVITKTGDNYDVISLSQTSEKNVSDNKSANSDLNKSLNEKNNHIVIRKPNFLENFQKHYVVILLCLMVSFGGFVFGWDTGSISGFVGMSDFKKSFAEYDIEKKINSFSGLRIGMIISLFNIGCAIGGITLPKLGDKYGRKFGITSSMVIYMIGIILQISSSHYIQYCVGRIVAGFGVGSVSVLCPMFIAETSPSEIRGLTVSFYQLMITLGIFFGYITTFGTSVLFIDSNQWRTPLGLCFVWAITLIVGISLLPESPRFLLSNDSNEKARKSIAKINNLNPDDLFVTEELEAIIAGIEEEKNAGSATWHELFHGKPHICTRLLIGIALQSFQQLTGNNYFFYYGTSIFNSIGLTNSYITSIILGAVNFVSTIVALFTINTFSRRATLICGSILMTVMLFLFSFVGSELLFKNSYDGETNPFYGCVMVVTTCIFIAVFAMTWAPGVFVVVSETYPLRIRSRGMAMATAANCIWGFLITLFTPLIVSKIGFYYGYVFMGFTIASIFFVLLMVPETSGLSLEEIDDMYTYYKLMKASQTRLDRVEANTLSKIQVSGKTPTEEKNAIV